VVLTIPVLKYICQNRFTVTRAVKGFDGSTSHFARPRRFGGYAVGDETSTAGTIGVTTSPGLSYIPRINTCDSRGAGMSSMTMTVGRL
jgi:hypothetical protein